MTIKKIKKKKINKLTCCVVTVGERVVEQSDNLRGRVHIARNYYAALIQNNYHSSRCKMQFRTKKTPTNTMVTIILLLGTYGNGVPRGG